ncbi:MAG: efflux RND transporter periplasmic adaptor subunit [Bacteroidota bacterium]
MKKEKLVACVLIFTGILSACTPEADEQDNQDKQEARPVKIMTLKKDTVERTLSYTANLVAWEEVNLAPAKPGRIKEIFVEEGDRIAKGQELVKMDKTELTQALLQLEDARTNFHRMDTLYELNSISKQQYDQAKTQYEMALANIEFLTENTTLTAPFNGIVTNKFFEGGEIYSGSPTTQGGKSAILTVMQISPIKAMVNVSERYFPYIDKGMKVYVGSDIYPDKTFTGRIDRIHPTIDPATRTFKTEIKIDNRDTKLRPGMFVRVKLIIKNDATLLAPAIAVIKQEGTNNRYVFVHEDGIARQIWVKIGDRFDDQLEILSDELKPDMELIIAGQANLMDGDSIKINN